MSWNPTTWGNLIPCGLKGMLDDLVNIVKWLFEQVKWLILPSSGDFDSLFSMWNDISGKGPFGLLAVIEWPSTQLTAMKNSVDSHGSECLNIPGPPGQESQQYPVFCANDARTGWRQTARTVSLVVLLLMFALWLYHFAMGVIRR